LEQPEDIRIVSMEMVPPSGGNLIEAMRRNARMGLSFSRNGARQSPFVFAPFCQTYLLR
jgi:hypothetical protein